MIATLERPPTIQMPSAPRRTRNVAIVTGVLGFLLAILTPLLPLAVDDTTLSWPQGDSPASVTAPLVSYSPVSFDARIPCAAATQLPNGGVLVATAPKTAADLERYGLVARVTDGRLQVVMRNFMLLDTPITESCTIVIGSDATRTSVGIDGAAPSVLNGDFRPQLVGVFSDLRSVPAGLQVTAKIDSRFTSTPTLVKRAAIVVGILLTLVSLLALHRIEALDGRRARRFLPQRWWRFTSLDGVVLGTLVIWHFIGATTSDDGYQFGMARMSIRAGYMANYFRYFGVPETPFGTPYYDLLGVLTRITTASAFVRLPALLAGILVWLVISREVAPRLGVAVGRSRLAAWTGALLFLAFWLPYNNGLRPEPIIALGVLLTWCSVERMVATRRLLPAAAAVLIAAATLTVGPSGLICLAALLAGARTLVEILVTRAKSAGFGALLAPLAAAGAAVLFVVFADQGVGVVSEMHRVHAYAGPNVAWFDEYMRYQWLFMPTPDGSLARRFAMVATVLCLGACLLVLLRKGGRIPGAAVGPAQRLIGVTTGAIALMMFTPTKWTHQLGVFAGLAGALAVLTAAAVAPAVLRSRRNRALFAAIVAFVVAQCFSSKNAWWYPSQFRVPWEDKPPSINGVAFAKVLLVVAVLMLAVAAWAHIRNTAKPPGRWWGLPALTIAAGFMVVFEVLSMTKAAVSQYPAFSIARSNVDAVLGKPCGMANDVLVETDPNASVLQLVPGQQFAAQNNGFDADGVAADLSADKEITSEGTANSVEPKSDVESSNNPAGTGSGVGLPFGLDPARVPVLGSYRGGEQATASLTTGWYQLPRDGDIVAIAAAGRIRSFDRDGIETFGQGLEVEYGRDGTALGKVTPIDIGPAPSWRNLRVPLSEIPREADMIRLVVTDNDRNPDQWLAITPPRVPKTQVLNDLVGSKTPVLLDWAVGLQFPCQRPADHHDGVSEVPQYRILPDRVGAATTNRWQDHFGGGPLGWTQLLVSAQAIPSYLRDDWRQDWGELERLRPLDDSARQARLDVTQVDRSGLWSPGPIVTTF